MERTRLLSVWHTYLGKHSSERSQGLRVGDRKIMNLLAITTDP